MKKIFFLSSILLILFLVSSCKIPDKIHFSGTPKLKFAAGLDFTDVFADLMGEAFETGDALIIKNCINAPNYMTFLIRMELVDEAIDMGSIFSPGSSTVRETPLLPAKPITLPLSHFNDMLPGFRFNTGNIESKLFISGSPIVNKFNLKLNGQPINDIPVGVSGIKSNEVYDKNVPPTGGVSVDNIINPLIKIDSDMTIDIEVSLKAGTYTAAELTNQANIVVELVIWMPLVFEAVNDGAEFKLPGFEDLGEFLFSLTTDSDDMVKSLTLEIGLAHNPFKDGIFIVRNIDDPDYELFKIRMDASLISFNVRAEDIAYINKFKEKNNDAEIETDFAIKFAKGAHLVIPNTLEIMSISLEADLDSTISILGGE
jgi:hypothetical protein